MSRHAGVGDEPHNVWRVHDSDESTVLVYQRQQIELAFEQQTGGVLHGRVGAMRHDIVGHQFAYCRGQHAPNFITRLIPRQAEDRVQERAIYRRINFDLL